MALLEEFSQFGEVEYLRIRSAPLIHSRKPREGAMNNDSVNSVHAYILFKMEKSAQASLSHNMAVGAPASEEAESGRSRITLVVLKKESLFLWNGWSIK